MDNFEELKETLKKLRNLADEIAKDAVSESESTKDIKKEIARDFNEKYDEVHNDEACEQCRKTLKEIVDGICKNEEDISSFILLTTNSVGTYANRIDLLNMIVHLIENLVNENMLNESAVRKLVEIAFTKDKEKINKLREETLEELMKMAKE